MSGQDSQCAGKVHQQRTLFAQGAADVHAGAEPDLEQYQLGYEVSYFSASKLFR